MIKEIYYFLRYGPGLLKRQKELGPVEFQKTLVREADADGYDKLRTSLVGDLEGDILEIGAGTGATFPYYGPQANVTAIGTERPSNPSEIPVLQSVLSSRTKFIQNQRQLFSRFGLLRQTNELHHPAKRI